MAKEPETLLNLFVFQLTEPDRTEILREGQIYDDRPSILRGEGGQYSDGYNWLFRYRQVILGLILRKVDISNRLLYQLYKEKEFDVGEFRREEVSILRFSSLHSREAEKRQRPLITEVTVASSVLSVIYLEFASAIEFLGIPVSPPQVDIQGGSVNVAMSGSLFTVGLGLLVACNDGLLNAPIAGPIAGGALAAAGMIELVLGWQHKAADTARIRMETRKSQLEHEMKEIEIKLKQLELQKVQVEAQKNQNLHNDDISRSPMSGFIPREYVLKNAAELGLTEAFANHIINRVLPKFLGLRHLLQDWDIEKK